MQAFGGRHCFVLVLLLLLLLLTTCGCGREQASEALPIERWTLVAQGRTEQIDLPVHLREQVPDEPSQYTLRAQVALPDRFRGRELELYIPSFAAHLTLRAAGRRYREVDRRDPTATRGVGPHLWVLDATDQAVIDLELTVEHRWTQSAWIDTLPVLRLATPSPTPGLVVSVSNLGARVAVGTLLPIGFAYFVLFVLDRRRVGAFFSVQALSGSYYALSVLGVSEVFGRFDLALLSFTTVLAPIAGLRVTFENLALGKLPRVFPAMIVFAAAFSVIFRSPFDALKVAGLVVVFGTVTLGYHLFRLALLARPRAADSGAAHDSSTRRKARILMVAWSAVAIGLVTDGPMWVGQGEPFGGVRLGCWGLTVNALCQAIVLVMDHVASLRRTEELNEQLTARVAELEARSQENAQLGAELRHQVASRSEALARALGRLPRAGTLVADLTPDHVVDRRYAIEQMVGAGGMGSVYAAVRLTDGRRVALKVIKRASSADRTARFAREAMLGSKIVHPNVVNIIDIGISDDGIFYLVMDLIVGLPLGKACRGQSVDWILRALAQAARGLLAIHSANVVHRDLKPSNILVETHTGVVKITDFGISINDTSSPDAGVDEGEEDDKTTDEASTIAPPERALRLPARVPAREARRPEPAAGEDGELRLTATGVAIGTPLYTAPEVRAGKRAGREADVYAFALLSIELFAGAHPLRDASARSRAGEKIPAHLFQLLESALALDPARRPTVATLVAALEGAAPPADLAAS